MLYIIAAIVLLLLGAIIGGEQGCGCVLFFIIAFILWRIGVLGLILRLVMWVTRGLFSVLKWIFIRIVYYSMRIWEFFDEHVLDFILLGM